MPCPPEVETLENKLGMAVSGAIDGYTRSTTTATRGGDRSMYIGISLLALILLIVLLVILV
jgi:hypothetical protein